MSNATVLLPFSVATGVPDPMLFKSSAHYDKKKISDAGMGTIDTEMASPSCSENSMGKPLSSKLDRDLAMEIKNENIRTNQIDWFELMQMSWGQALSRIGKQIIGNLKPADRISLIYLLITLPLCFIAEDIRHMAWAGIFMRLFLIPLVIYFRSFCVYTTTSLGKPKIWTFYLRETPLSKKVSKLLGSQTTPKRQGEPVIEISIGWVEVVYIMLDWYVAALFGILYSEAGVLIENLHGPQRYDNELKRLEEEIFYGQPSKDLREWYPTLNSRMLGEYLHFCYFTYYLLIVGVALVMYLSRPREQFDQCMAALSLGFFSCFGFYLSFPVEGPYWSFPRPDPEQVSYFFCYVVRWVLVGSSKGTAMPSSHCAISTVCWVLAWRYHIPLAIVYTLFVPGLIFATVWCGFHYGLDAGSGTIWGIVCGIGGILLAKYIPYNRPYHDRLNYGSAVLLKSKYNPAKYI